MAEVANADLKLPQNQWNWIRAVSPYLIKGQDLNEMIAVRAVDSAGNARVETITPPAPAPKTSNWHVAMVLPYLAIIGIAGFAIVKLILRFL